MTAAWPTGEVSIDVTAPEWKASSCDTFPLSRSALKIPPSESWISQWPSPFSIVCTFADARPASSPASESSNSGTISKTGFSSVTSAPCSASRSQTRTWPSAPPVIRRSPSWRQTSIEPSWQRMPFGRVTSHLMRLPSQRRREPQSEPDTTFPSGSSAKPQTSDRSIAPNLPIAPCSLSPVNVRAIRQNRMWPVPEVMSEPSKRGEKATWYTSCENALARRMIASCSQFHTVSM